MKTNKTLKLTLSLFCMMPFCYLFASTKYPLVSSVAGKSWLTGSDGKKIATKVKTLLRGKALIETEALGELKIQWDATRELTILENSTVSIPAIAWETGEAPVVLLKTGSIRWRALAKGDYNVALHSNLFEFIAPTADFIISINSAKALVEVKMLAGKMEFSAINAEEVAILETRKKVSFQGVIEEGQIAYDVLLQGRKIPRGKLSAVTDLDPADAAIVEGEAAKAKKLREQQKRVQKSAEKKRQIEGQICEKPAAKLNECAWTCQGNPKKEKKICRLADPQVHCVRRRCNANGDWAEEFVLGSEKASSLCKSTDQVGPCDY